MDNYNKNNSIYFGFDNKKALFDLFLPNKKISELIIFAHGYMGFKDWGAWNQLADFFTSENFGFLKFNFSHNGTSIENKEEFEDLTSFAKNNYSVEVFDLEKIIEHVQTEYPRIKKIHLIGHSRGGGICLIVGAKNKIVSSISTLASISSIEKRFSDEKLLASWKKNGIRYLINQRTKQEMPHNYSQVIDFEKNKDQLSIEKSISECAKPICLIHGKKDTSVHLSEGKDLALWSKTTLQEIENANHVFGATHPWKKEDLPEDLKTCCKIILNFLRTIPN